MRTIIAILGFIFLTAFYNLSGIDQNTWTEKRVVEAKLVQKWEDWSTNGDGAVRQPYKGLFQVNLPKRGGSFTEVVSLSAQNYSKAVPNDGTVWTYTTNYKDLGVPPTQAEAKRDTQQGVFFFLAFILWPVVVFGMWVHWLTDN